MYYGELENRELRLNPGLSLVKTKKITLGKEQRKFTSSHPKVSKYAKLLKTLSNFVIIKRDSL